MRLPGHWLKDGISNFRFITWNKKEKGESLTTIQGDSMKRKLQYWQAYYRLYGDKKLSLFETMLEIFFGDSLPIHP